MQLCVSLDYGNTFLEIEAHLPLVWIYLSLIVITVIRVFFYRTACYFGTRETLNNMFCDKCATPGHVKIFKSKGKEKFSLVVRRSSVSSSHILSFSESKLNNVDQTWTSSAPGAR